MIAFASLLARRFGPAVGGWLIGLPVTRWAGGARSRARARRGLRRTRSPPVSSPASRRRRRSCSATSRSPGAVRRWISSAARGLGLLRARGILLETAGLPLPLLLACRARQSGPRASGSSRPAPPTARPASTHDARCALRMAAATSHGARRDELRLDARPRPERRRDDVPAAHDDPRVSASTGGRRRRRWPSIAAYSSDSSR